MSKGAELIGLIRTAKAAEDAAWTHLPPAAKYRWSGLKAQAIRMWPPTWWAARKAEKATARRKAAEEAFRVFMRERVL